jgi:hypothetical protein
MTTIPIKIRVLETKDQTKLPWEMTISDPQSITAYMIRGNLLMFNYRGDIYQAYDLTEQQFLTLCPHLTYVTVEN